jgi:hypothetical protein
VSVVVVTKVTRVVSVTRVISVETQVVFTGEKEGFFVTVADAAVGRRKEETEISLAVRIALPVWQQVSEWYGVYGRVE